MDDRAARRTAREEANAALAQQVADSVQRVVLVRRPATTIVAVLVVLAAVYFARPVLIPICFAWLLKVALAPAVRRLRRVGVPIPLGSGLVLVAMTSAFVVAVYRLAEPAARWVQTLPAELPEIERKLISLRQPLDTVSDVTHSVEKIADSSPGIEVPVTVEVAGRQTLLGRLFSGAWLLLVGVALTLVLLFFLLATDEVLLGKLVEATPKLQDKKAVVGVVRSIETEVGRYLLTVSLLNASLGVCVGAAMALLGMPNPALWGALAAVLNFVPYVGAVVGVSVVAAVALITFDSLGDIVAPPLVYLALNSLEGLLVTPMVLGRRLAISPVALFVWLLFASWMWGLPGALLAVPMLVVIKITSDEVSALAPLSSLIGK